MSERANTTPPTSPSCVSTGPPELPWSTSADRVRISRVEVDPSAEIVSGPLAATRPGRSSNGPPNGYPATATSSPTAGSSIGSGAVGEPVDGDEREVVLGVERHDAPGQCRLAGRLDDGLGDPGHDVRVRDDAIGCHDEAAAREVAAALEGVAGDAHHRPRGLGEHRRVDGTGRRFAGDRRRLEHVDEPGDALAERCRAQLGEQRPGGCGGDRVEGLQHPRPRDRRREHRHAHRRDARRDEGDDECGDEQVADRAEHAVEHAELHGMRAAAQGAADDSRRARRPGRAARAPWRARRVPAIRARARARRPTASRSTRRWRRR